MVIIIVIVIVIVVVVVVVFVVAAVVLVIVIVIIIVILIVIVVVVVVVVIGIAIAIVKSIIWCPASIRLSIRVSDRRSILMRFYSPVDLTGNGNVIEKLVLGGTGIGDLQILRPTH